MESFEKLLEVSSTIHGHLCAGQVIGVRLAMLGLREIGIDDPKGRDRKKLYVVVEIDRCATDAIQSVTGCTLGKRSLRWNDFGIM
ncbi:MAG: formylmethanofuran dehydrogenase, partial [Desulfobulbaceae bacterium A2]